MSSQDKENLVSKVRRLLARDSTLDPGQQRWRAVIQTAGASTVSRAISLGALLLQVPIALSYLGLEAFGFWAVLTSMGTFLQVTDLGMGLGLQNRVSKAVGEGQLRLVPKLAATAFRSLTWVAIGVFILGIGALKVGLLGKLFPLSDPVALGGVDLNVTIAVIAFSLSIPMAVSHRVAIGLQLGWISSLAGAVMAVLVLVAVVAGALMELSFPVFLCLALTAPFLSGIGVLIVLMHRMKWGLAEFRTIPGKGRTLLRHGLLFVLPQVSAVTVNQYPILVLSGLLGPASVVPWVVTTRLLGLITQIHGMIIGPFWPAFAEAAAKGDHKWIVRTQHRTLVFSIVYGCISGGVLLASGEVLILAWTGDPLAVPSIATLLPLVIWGALQVFVSPAVTLLNAVDRLKIQSLCAFMTIIVTIIVAPIAARHFGISGVAIVLACTFGLFSVPMSFGETVWLLRSYHSRGDHLVLNEVERSRELSKL